MIKSRITKFVSVASIAVGVVQYFHDYLKYYKKNTRLFKISTAAFILCIVSNAVSILLAKFNLSKCRSCIKQFLWFLGTSFGLAISTTYWVYDLVFVTCAKYTWLKNQTKKHY